MVATRRRRWLPRATHVVLALALSLLGLSCAADPASLRARHAELAGVLQGSEFGRPVYVESQQAGQRLRGAVYAVLDHPFVAVRDALRQPGHWCDIMILPFNTKYCHVLHTQRGPALLVRIARRPDQPLERAYPLMFDWREVAATPEYFESRLLAPQGPMGTHDYHIVLSAIALNDGRTFMRLGYSYAVGFTGRMAMQAYLATAGADKVGFTRPGGAQAGYIGGMRGVVERNAMRYYLAVDAFLESMQAPPAQRVERRIQAWFDATERYPRQLREMDRATYTRMKRADIARQRTLVP